MRSVSGGPAWGCPPPTLALLSPAGQCFDYCENEGVCQMTASGVKQCRCPPQFEGAQCQENKCSRCQEGKCSINKQNGEVSCMYVPGLVNSKEGEGLGGHGDPRRNLYPVAGSSGHGHGGEVLVQ